MSHELRTPLNGILGFADLLNQQFFGPLNDKQNEYVKHIDTSGKHLLSLVNDLLDIAKVDAGAVELFPEPIDPRQLAEAPLAMMNAQFLEKNLAVETHTDPGLGPVLLDKRKYNQIMLNLLSNAVKYTPEGGRITVNVQKSGDGDTLYVSVRDTGCGIAANQQTKIFSEFHQADQVRDTDLGGTGIGLALTRRLVLLQGGDIGVESKVGEGSLFWFKLPYQPAQPEAPMPEVEEQKIGLDEVPSARILLVEDNDINVAVMLDTLRVRGYDVAVARNGREAIDLAQSYRPDLIFMDVCMPVMGGVEATRELRRLEGQSQVPIIALSANSDKESVQECLEAGCDHHLGKPFQLDELYETIDQFLGAAQVSKTQ